LDISLSIPRARQDGVSLLTLALVLLLLSGALMAGVSYLRAALPDRAIATAQRLALARADEAILGFASIHHRLPCPAQTPNGGENCDLAKGYLPVTALGLDAMLHTPDTLTMRYVVYRNTADLAVNGPVMVTDNSIRQLPDDKYDPTPKGDDGKPLVTTFNARNGLDMCETMRLAYKDRATSPERYAHYKRGGTPYSVAYGLALPGAGDRSDNGNPFDGVNAGDIAEMDAPDRGGGSDYDDFVFVRDFPSLMSAFGCQPVDYHVVRDYVDRTAAGDDFASEIGTVLESFLGTVAPDKFADKDKVVVKYDEKGTVTPVLASVESVKMAVSMIKSANDKFDSTEESIKKTFILSSIQSAYDIIGTTLAIIKTVDSSIKIGKTISTIVASLGTYASGYAAIALYGTSIGFQIVSTALTTAAMINTVQATARIGIVYSRFSGDLGFMTDFCDTIKQGMEGLNQAGSKQQEEVENAKKDMDKAKIEMDNAYASLTDTENKILACYQSNTAAKAGYAPFADLDKRDELFGARIALENEAARIAEEIKAQEKTMKESDTSDPAVRTRIEKDIADFATALEEPVPAAYRASVYAKYDEQYAAAKAKKEVLEAQKLTTQAQLNVAKEALKKAVDALPAGDAPPTVASSAPLPVWTNCNHAYQRLHEAYWAFSAGTTAPYPPSPLARSACHATQNERGAAFCDDYYYASLWRLYYDKKEEYEASKERYESLAAQPAPPDVTPASDSCSGGFGDKISIWPHAQAMDILLRVDKRGALQ
jgi:hypothetical protein